MADKKDPIDPFKRVLALMEPLDMPDSKPLHEVMPWVWPTMGDLRRLVEKYDAR